MSCGIVVSDLPTVVFPYLCVVSHLLFLTVIFLAFDLLESGRNMGNYAIYTSDLVRATFGLRIPCFLNKTQEGGLFFVIGLGHSCGHANFWRELWEQSAGALGQECQPRRLLLATVGCILSVGQATWLHLHFQSLKF